MRFLPLCVLIATCVSLPVFAQNISPEQMRQAQEMARQYMNNPAYQQQMQQMQQQMKSQGLQGGGQMDEGMKKMTSMNPKNMDAMVKMSKCMMDGIGEKAMKEMGAKGEALDKKIKALCSAGKQSEAEKVAKDYAGEMMQSREYKVMKSCSEQYQAAYNDPALKDMRTQMQQMEGKEGGVCGG